MNKTKLYFNYEDDYCHTLDFYIRKARCDNKEVVLYEAVIDNDSGFIFCKKYDIIRTEECNSSCYGYTPRGTNRLCKHKGNMYKIGNKVDLKIK